MALNKIGIAANLILLSVFIFSCNRDSEKKSPNLIVIMADDLGYADVGFNGCTDIPTPNIDRIANDGIKFTNGYVAYWYAAPAEPGLSPDVTVSVLDTNEMRNISLEIP